MGYVLVNDGDVIVKPADAAAAVQVAGVKHTAEGYGVSEGKLRQFLNANGWHGKRSTSWELEIRQEYPSTPEDTEQMPQVPVPAGEDEVPF